MKIIIAPQEFKGTMSSMSVAQAIHEGVIATLPEAETVSMPIADGGTGTVEALVSATKGHYVDTPTVDPLGRPIIARWGVLGDKKTAVIETASASGLALLRDHERLPLVTSTEGTGRLLRTALDEGYRRILVGLGDSATNDGGMGFARGIGIRALNILGEDLPAGGGALDQLAKLDLTGAHKHLFESQIIALCDVTNVLCGNEGASVVFGPQKGADIAAIETLDRGLSRFVDVVQKQFNLDMGTLVGGGAAGGLGAGLVALCGGELRSGFDVISEYLKIEDLIATADILITGEGRLDFQTRDGKGVGRVAAIAKQNRVQIVIAIVGQNRLTIDQVRSIGIDYIVSLDTNGESRDDVSNLASDSADEIRLAVEGLMRQIDYTEIKSKY
ncbi:MAG: glycerate kinase [SAR202 cluster bacterium]|nr:glycerate kinase [SAR202 cluster bacterium]|tara:strand:- start:14070 stop:15230 length:1161 start_codon:yes stop_codon:yes gene_type:complete